jgi:hypothetical protein
VIEPPRVVLRFFEEVARLPAVEAWAVAADAFEGASDSNQAMKELKVGGIVESLATSPSRSRLPDLARAGIDPRYKLGDLKDEERRAIAEALRTGRALRATVAA